MKKLLVKLSESFFDCFILSLLYQPTDFRMLYIKFKTLRYQSLIVRLEILKYRILYAPLIIFPKLVGREIEFLGFLTRFTVYLSLEAIYLWQIMLLGVYYQFFKSSMAIV